ncbi:MAG: T9SS type A sorting domain-containing protein [Bacteroidales bacterium]|nr:T9SS type A sorting domain-containing protein [Bacteroidales bacterium]MDD3666740.1 T9SS type A sorting domain-containing protein [Bacteroidales bacterium]
MKKTLLLTFFISLYLITLGGVYSGGSGTAADPYRIANLNDLSEMSSTYSDRNKHFIQTMNIDASATSSWYDGGGWRPIGLFSGTYNGQNYVISNLFIKVNLVTVVDANGVGLFGTLQANGIVKNLGMLNASVVCEMANISGVIVGTNYGTVQECYSTGLLTDGPGWNTFWNYAGGLVGLNYGTIGRSFSEVSLVVTETMSAGGLVGRNYGTISNSYARGSISGNCTELGGLVAKNGGVVNNCYSVGAVSATTPASAVMGGLIAVTVASASCTNSFWDQGASGQSISAGGQGLSGLDMIFPSTFTNAGWDYINETANGTSDYWYHLGYPRLNTETIWVGTSDNNWDNALNWSPQAIPSNTNNVSIPFQESLITPGTSATCNNLTVSSTSGLTIQSGGSLIAGSVTGEITVHRNLNGSGRYYFISSPVNSADLATIFPSGQVSSIFFRSFVESSGNWVNHEIPYNLINGKGYSFYLASGTSCEATFTGSAITTNVTPVLTNIGSGGVHYAGWNLLGNPFTSSIQWGQGDWNLNDVSNGVYVWSNGSYKSYVGGVGELTNGIIPPQQGFFVKANGASPSLTIPANARVHSSQPFYKETTAEVLRLGITNNQNEYSDAAYIRFTPDATAGFDNDFDAYKLENAAEAPMIFTNADDVNLSINALPSIEEFPEIVVAFNAGTEGVYTLTASGMESFPSGDIILTDLKNNARQSLRQNPVYFFNSSVVNEPERFKISFTTVGIMENSLNKINILVANNMLELHFPEMISGMVAVSNLAGQIVANLPVNGKGIIRMNSPHVPGIYFVSLTTASGTITQKVFVK